MAENQMHGFGQSLQHFVCSTHPRSTSQSLVGKLVEKKLKDIMRLFSLRLVVHMREGCYPNTEIPSYNHLALRRRRRTFAKRFFICVVVVSPSDRRPPAPSSPSSAPHSMSCLATQMPVLPLSETETASPTRPGSRSSTAISMLILTSSTRMRRRPGSYLPLVSKPKTQMFVFSFPLNPSPPCPSGAARVAS